MHCLKGGNSPCDSVPFRFQLSKDFANIQEVIASFYQRALYLECSSVLVTVDVSDLLAHSTKPEDGRVQLLSLTRQGNRILPELTEIADQNDREFFEGLDSGEKVTLRRLLVKLVEFHQIRNVPIE